MKESRRLKTAALALAAVLAPPLAPAAGAQSGVLSFDQVQRKFRGMNEVHIAKCDRNGDGGIDQREMGCVRGIYQVMYVDG